MSGNTRKRRVKTSPPPSASQAMLGQYISAHDSVRHAQQALQEQPKHFSLRRLLKRTVLIVLALLLLVGSWVSWQFYSSAVKLTGDKNPLQILSLFLPTTLNESNGRVNFLLVGYSADDPGHQGAQLTDSIMVISINPHTKTAVLLSIPRDLWVNIPGYGYAKINSAYEDGEAGKFSQAGYDPGGMGLLEEIIAQDFGIQTNYYGLINYSAFRDAVNSVGGVTVTIQSPDPQGLYDPNTHLNLPNGKVTLDGQQALNLARARGDGYGSYGFPQGDFNRTQHQQQLLIALKDKVGSAGFLINPLRVAHLANAVGNNVTTNASLGVMETLYRDTKGATGSAIQSVTLNDYQGQSLLRGYITYNGQDALVPTAGPTDYSQIQSAVRQLFSE